MSKVYPLASQGSRSEASSGELPKQANMDVRRHRRSELVARELVIRVR